MAGVRTALSVAVVLLVVQPVPAAAVVEVVPVFGLAAGLLVGGRVAPELSAVAEP